MKKYILFLAIGLIVLNACKSDDHKPPVQNKLTRITCYEGDMATPAYTVNISYSMDGRISSYTSDKIGKREFVFVGNSLTITGDPRKDYTLKGDNIIQEKILSKNQQASNEEYISNEYEYRYGKNNLEIINWLTRWPSTGGSGYDTRQYTLYLDWEKGNIYRFREDKKEMIYEYSDILQPQNFPFRVINTFRPVGFEIIDPVNLMYGNLNRNLPTRAYWYNVPETSTICAEYEFNYNFLSDYLSEMTINVKNNLVNEEDNYRQYKYTFEYNYETE